jgi:two-component system, cell cycle sensor histidine kinase and response regulator CckA
MLGYQTLAAASGAEALEVARAQQKPVPVLLTDIVMPGMNGRQLADQLHQISPALKVIFMSGYTDLLLTNPSKLSYWAAYLQKPFTVVQLGEVIRQAEEAKDA